MRPGRWTAPVVLRLREARDLLAALGAQLVATLIALLPPRAAFALARACGRLLYGLLRRRRRIALRNLQIALGEARSLPERRRIARGAFEHAASQLVSLVHRQRHVRDPRDPHVFEISPAADAWLEEARARGEAVAFLGGHIGDWEMALHYLALRGLPLTVVGRRVGNARIDERLRRLREASGARVVPKEGALRELRRSLRDGRSVGLITDQNAPERRDFLPFFGMPASTYIRHAHVLLAYAHRIAHIACWRTGPAFSYRVAIEDLGAGLIEDARGSGQARASRQASLVAARELVRRHLAALEADVRRAPEQYFWIHRRWKSRPTGTPWLYGDLGRSLDPGVLALARAGTGSAEGESKLSSALAEP